ncbi:MAG: PfkB family carbohydrate kinase [Candidatus Limnocylindrales bacterium]
MTTRGDGHDPRAASRASAPPTARLSLVAIGDNCIDEYVDLGLATVGGQAANVAVQWARLGARSEYVGPVGTDSAGGIVLEALGHAGVSIEHVRRLDGATGVTEITLTSSGERVFGRSDPGVCRGFTPSWADLSELDRTCTWVHLANLGTIPATVRDVRAVLPAVGISFDLSDEWGSELRDVDLAGVDVAFFSWHAEPGAAAFEQARRLSASGAGLVVGTCGPYGSFAWHQTDVRIEPARQVAAVDTCGAGDAYTARFLLERIRGRPLLACLRAATETAADACTFIGSFPQVPRAVSTGGRR